MLAIARNILILFSVGLIVILVGCSSSPSNQTTAIETETEMDHEDIEVSTPTPVVTASTVSDSRNEKGKEQENLAQQTEDSIAIPESTPIKSISATPVTTATTNIKLDPKTLDVGCANPILGSSVIDEIRFKGRQLTATELEKILHCFPEQELTQDPKYAGEEYLQPSTENPIPVGNIRNVSLPTSNHAVSKNVQCEVFEDKECTELRWERIDGLLAGAITSIQVAPTDSEVIYAGIDSNSMSLWRSLNSGKNWEKVYQWAHASDVAINPINPSTILYSELEEGVYRSTDGGSSWKSVIGDRDRPDWVRSSGLYFKALTFSTHSPQVAYAVASVDRGPSSGSAEVFVSADAGQNWNHSGTCENCGSVYDVVVEPDNSTNIWLSADSGVHLSDDGGANWSDNLLTNLSSAGSATIGLSINPTNSEIIIAATSSSGVYRSADKGETWKQSNTGLGELHTHQVEFALSDPNIIWLTTHDGVYQSTDTGQTWTRRDNGWKYTFTDALSIDPYDSDVVYVGTAVELQTAHANHINTGIHEGGGLYKTVNGGEDWLQIDQDMEESSVVAMATHPYLPFSLWVGDKAGRGAFVTPDAGETWLHATWSGAHYPMVFAFSHSFPSKHFLSSAMTGEELTVSDDGGLNWRSLANGLGTAIDQSSRASRLPSETGNYFHVHLHGLAVSPSDPDILYTGTIYDPSLTEEYSMMGAVIFTSRDGGKTWKESSNGFPIDTPTSLNAFVIHPTDPNVAYAMTSSYESERPIGIFKTENGGSNWRAVNKGLDLNTRDLQIDPVYPETLYAATGSGVYKTTDGAASWTLISEGLPTSGSGSVQEKLLLSTIGSDDRGGIWDLAINPLNPLQIYAATNKGVYKTKDGGEYWYAVNFGLPLSEGNPFWHDRVLEIDATGTVLYVCLDPSPNGDRVTHIYRAVMEPLVPVKYQFEVNGDFLEIESTSQIYNTYYDQDEQALHFTVAGPSQTKAETILNVPVSLLVKPFVVTMDGKPITPSSNGQQISFEYLHTGRVEIIVKENR